MLACGKSLCRVPDKPLVGGVLVGSTCLSLVRWHRFWCWGRGVWIEMVGFLADVLGESWERVVSVFYRVKYGPAPAVVISPFHTSARVAQVMKEAGW